MIIFVHMNYLHPQSIPVIYAIYLYAQCKSLSYCCIHLVLKKNWTLISKVNLTVPLHSTVKHYIYCTQDHNNLILWISMSCHTVHSLNPIFCNKGSESDNAPLNGSSHELKQKCYGHTPDYHWPSSNAQCNYYSISLCALGTSWSTWSQANRHYFNDNSQVMSDMICLNWVNG